MRISRKLGTQARRRADAAGACDIKVGPEGSYCDIPMGCSRDLKWGYLTDGLSTRDLGGESSNANVTKVRYRYLILEEL